MSYRYKTEYIKKIANKDFSLCGKRFKRNAVLVIESYYSQPIYRRDK